MQYSIFDLDLNTIMSTSSLIDVNITQQGTTITGAAIKIIILYTARLHKV